MIDNLLVQISLIVKMIWWTSLAPWEFEFPFPGSLVSTFLRWVNEFVILSWVTHVGLVAACVGQACSRIHAPLHAGENSGDEAVAGLVREQIDVTHCISISLRRSTPLQNRRLDVSISNSKQSIEDFVGDFLRLIDKYIL